MKTNNYNICPTCIYKHTCVLTDQKNKVWSCSEYEEIIAKENSQIKDIKARINYSEEIVA